MAMTRTIRRAAQQALVRRGCRDVDFHKLQNSQRRHVATAVVGFLREGADLRLVVLLLKESEQPSEWTQLLPRPPIDAAELRDLLERWLVHELNPDPGLPVGLARLL